MKEALEGIKILYIALTNFKLYKRWAKIQYLKNKRLIKLQEIKNKEILAEQELKNNIKKFALRKTPKLLNFYKGLRTLKKILWKTFLFILMAVSIIIVIIIICHLWGWICENPLWVIAILLFLNLVK